LAKRRRRRETAWLPILNNVPFLWHPQNKNNAIHFQTK
jgi:hypothetical protein